MQNKIKGLSLIETVIALGILSLVFSGTILLIVNILNLAMITRDKTEATAAAQAGLSDATAQIQSCGPLFAAPPTYDPTPVAGKYEKIINTKKVTIFFDDAFLLLDGTAPATIVNTKYVKVLSEVTWKYRGVDQKVSVFQYIRKP